MTDNAVDLIDKLLKLNPDKRWSAKEALDADFFFENQNHLVTKIPITTDPLSKQDFKPSKQNHAQCS